MVILFEVIETSLLVLVFEKYSYQLNLQVFHVSLTETIKSLMES